MQQRDSVASAEGCVVFNALDQPAIIMDVGSDQRFKYKECRPTWLQVQAEPELSLTFHAGHQVKAVPCPHVLLQRVQGRDAAAAAQRRLAHVPQCRQVGAPMCGSVGGVLSVVLESLRLCCALVDTPGSSLVGCPSSGKPCLSCLSLAPVHTLPYPPPLPTCDRVARSVMLGLPHQGLPSAVCGMP